MNEEDIKNSIVRIEVGFYNSEKATLVTSNGTGFFIDKNKILTCYHVLRNHEKEEDIKVFLTNEETPYKVTILDKNETNDLAVLEIESNNKYFVQINDKVTNGNSYYSHGFPEIDENNEKLKEIRDRPLTLEVEGTTSNNEIIQFKNGQVKNGFSGSPILNLSTGAVCGIICISRNTSNTLGGYGIPIAKIELLEGIVIPRPIKVKRQALWFSNYTEKNEPYYIIRREDKQFVDCLEINNIWIFGASGQGKTALINRNLIQEEIEYIFCDLSPINITSPNDILDRIIGVIKRKFKIKVLDIEENRIITVVELLSEVKAQEIVIVIDEMAVEDTDLLISVAESFVNLVTYYTNCVGEESLKFVISTRAKPQDIIMNRAKASDYFEYICCDTWSEYLEKLFDSLSNALSLNITKENKNFILTSSESSPRTIKKILSKVFHSDYITDESIKHNVKLSLQESI